MQLTCSRAPRKERGDSLKNTDKLSPTSVAIFAARETPEVLTQTVAAALRAATPGMAFVDVIVNGNQSLAEQMASASWGNSGADAAQVRIWYLAQGDKANAWNQHIHHIWDGASLVFYVDGYVSVKPDAMTHLQQAMRAQPDALAGSGVPTVGRFSEQMRQQMMTVGGIHGNFCCIRGSTLQALRQRGIRLPLGLYRTDGTWGAVLSFRLDPARNEWNPKCIAVAPEASWFTAEKKWWRWKDLQASYKRLDRQAQGELENRAVRDHFAVRQMPPESMPKTAAELVLDWVARCPDDAAALLRSSPRIRRALERLRTSSTDWSAAAIAPELLSSGDERSQILLP